MPEEYSEDIELFQQIAAGDEKAFEIIFRKYLPRLKPFILGFVKVEAVTDEILQELFLKVWTVRVNLIHVGNPSSWLYKVASNLSLDQLRRQATEYKIVKESLEKEGNNTFDLFEHVSAKQLQNIIHEAIETLPGQRKRIYKLAKETGWPHKKIAEHLGISVSTVKNQVTNAVKDIQKFIMKSTGIYLPVVLILNFELLSACS